MSELGGPLVLSDTLGNPKAPWAAGFMLAFDGTNWFRVPGTAAAGLKVSLSQPVDPLDTNIAEFGDAAVSLGQKLSAASMPVVIASDQSSVSVTVVQPADPLDTNVAEFGDAAVSLGQKLMAASIPITIASDQSALQVSATDPLDMNLAEVGDAAVLTGNGTTGAGSQRVTIASDNTAFSVNATIVQPADPIDMNVAEINDVTVLTGNGVTGTGSQRVTIASDNTAFPVTANVGTLNNTTTFTTGLTISVTNAATVLLASNASRKGFALVNNGGQDVFVGNASVISGAAAGANGGLVLKANGGAWNMMGPGIYSGALSGITAANTSVVAAYEW